MSCFLLVGGELFEVVYIFIKTSREYSIKPLIIKYISL